MKIKINGYVVAEVDSWRDEPLFTWKSFDSSKYDSNAIVLSRQEIEIEVPDDFNMQAARVAALENEANKVRAAFHKRINEINGQISKLQALEG